MKPWLATLTPALFFSSVLSVSLLSLSVFSGSIQAASIKTKTLYQDTLLKADLVSELDGVIWGLTLINDTEAVLTLRKGQAFHLDLITGKQTKLSGLPKIATRGQGGLLDVAASPEYDESGWLYFTYSKPMTQGATVTLGRAKLSGSELINWEDIFITQSASSSGQHFGSRIAFDNQGYLYFGIGDRGERPNGQNLQNHAGSILRLHPDGRIPKDNPFVGKAAAQDAIWSYGHRNPQGLFFDKVTNTLWSNEHGPRGGDEINKIKRGANYGWPIVSHGKEYWGPISVGDGTEKEGIENPLKVFIPSIAPSALHIYQGQLFDGWQGNHISLALAKRHLNLVTFNSQGEPTENRYLGELDERFRSIAEDSKGYLYIGTDSGKLIRLSRSER
ncbi:MAG: PQQ-dependent sugar dehydrogenase [Marinomonas sp.]